MLARAGYKTTAYGEWSTTFTRRFVPGWAIILGLITLPFGLLFWAFARSTDVLVFDLTTQDGTIIATAAGSGPRKVAELLARLNREGITMQAASPPEPQAVEQGRQQ